MCGIYGFQVAPDAELSLYESTVITHHLAREMETRGRDSFGSVIFPEGLVYKGLGRVTECGVKLLKAASESRCFLAHTRAATVGDVVVENCHPFNIGNVIGVHNGSVYNYRTLNEKYKRPCMVDSEHVFYHINERLDLSEIEGYGTFFWKLKSEKNSKIYLAKTVSGSITIARLYRGDPKDGDNKAIGVIWASEYLPVRHAAGILGLEYESITIDPAKVYFIQDGEVYKTNETFDVKSSTFNNSNSGSYGKYVGYSKNTDDEDDDDAYIKAWLAEDKKKKEADLRDDILISPSSDVLTRGLISLLGNKNFSKKERKAIKRKLAYFKSKNKTKITEPSIHQLHNGVGFMRHYAPNLVSKEVETIFHCPECQCDLAQHLWGWCINDIRVGCKAKVGNGCNDNREMLRICQDCGHYLIQGVHNVDTKYEIVHCAVCNDYCVPESQIVKCFQDGDDEISEGATNSTNLEDETKTKLYLVPPQENDIDTQNSPDDTELLISE